MLDRQSSRALLTRMEGEAATILSNTPDSADYVTAADNLALDVQRLAEFLRELDKGNGVQHIGMKAHGRYAEHSHEVRADHRGVNDRPN